MEHNQSESKNAKLSSNLAEEIHARLFHMLKDLHKICVENHITYYMIGGTALGAVRHKGFIPWDDDVDIAMPRPDYERFSALAREKFPEYLELRWYKNTKNSPFQFIKLIDNRTTLKEEMYNNYVEGLYIDIFPLDGVKPDGFFENIRRRRIWFLHTLVIEKSSTKKKKTTLKRIGKRCIKTLNLKWLHNRLEKRLLAASYEDCPMVANFLGAWGEREIMEKRLFGTPKLYSFEGAEFFGPELVDEYLTNLYGDYMTPPPPEDQVFRHNYPFLDFDMPYKEYEAKINKKER